MDRQPGGASVRRKREVGDVLATLAAHGELVYAVGEEGMAAYWVATSGFDHHDPDTWEAPIRVGSARFRRLLHSFFDDIAPIKSRTKDYVEAAEAVAFSGRKLESVGWAGKEGHGTDVTIRVAVSPAIVICISRHNVHAERNGVHALFKLPADFAPLRWADLEQAIGQCANPAELRAARAAVVDHLPPPPPGTPLDASQQAALVLAWWAGMLAETICRGRPMLVMLGEPGSGKTLTADLLGTLYFGEHFEVGGGVGGGRAVKDLAASVVHAPLAVQDDLTNVKRETVDILCRLATGSAVKLATLHETMHLSSFKARGAIILTSARPEWALRDDLLSRILPVRFDKPGRSPMTSRDREARVLQHRPAAWAELILATQQALAAPQPHEMLTRFEDWEAIVQAIAEAGGWRGELIHALQGLDAQRVHVATSASLEVAALYAIAKQFEDDPRDWTVADLYDLVSEKMGAMLSEDQRLRPSGRMRLQEFSKFLRRVETEGSAAVTLHSRGERGGRQVWTIRPKA